MPRRPRRTSNRRAATDVDSHVGERLRQRRILLGLAQQQLANSLGVSFQQLQKYESGANRVSASRLYQLAQVLAVPIMWFYDGIGAPDGRGSKVSELSKLTGDPEVRRFVKAYHRIKGTTARRRFREIASVLAGDK
jgi:transcriptional regulator with XRE-family HTH domain